MVIVRRLVACALAMVLLAGGSPAGALAQGANPKDTAFVVGEGAGTYTQVAGTSVVGAFDRAVEAIDVAPVDGTPREVKDAPFRRRLLELRLLMDLNAYAYDRGDMQSFREIVDRSYEVIGVFQDITDIEKELGVPVNPDVVESRRVEMKDGLLPMQDGNVRGQLRRFLAAPLNAPRVGGAPRLWDLTGSSASNSFDAVGNAAEFQSGIIRHLQSVDLGVSDIFDPSQAAYFHAIRKDMRSVVLLSAMFPPTSEATTEAVKPLVELVGDYGDTLEAFTAYEYALQAGMDTSKVEAELRREFERALLIKGQFVDNRALDNMAIALNGVRDAHRR